MERDYLDDGYCPRCEYNPCVCREWRRRNRTVGKYVAQGMRPAEAQAHYSDRFGNDGKKRPIPARRQAGRA